MAIVCLPETKFPVRSVIRISLTLSIDHKLDDNNKIKAIKYETYR